MSTHLESQSPRERGYIYWIAWAVIGLMFLGSLVVFKAARDTAQARDKADELIAALGDAGARTPDRDQIVRVLGEDGGATCEDPNDALSRATLLSLLANGATGPGARPVIADSRAVQGQLLIIEVYCPEELEDFQEFVDDLKTDDVAGS
jgi:hypothetical protein